MQNTTKFRLFVLKINKVKKILFLFEDGLTPSALVHNMVPCVGVLNSQRSGHTFSCHIKKLSQEQTPLLEQNKTEFTVNARCDHQGHLGFDISHNRFAEAILKDLDINEYEAKRGFEILLVSIAAQMSLDRRKIVSREEFLASV